MTWSPESFCGCCGGPSSRDGMWCNLCEKHVLKTSIPPWERTYFAQTGDTCPFTEQPEKTMDSKK
jgi:hypothetical protein